MTQVQLATQDSIQNIKSKYAANGMGPNSTPEQQDINRVLQNQASTIAAIGQQLFSSGTADLQIDQSVLNSMLTANTSLNNQTNAAIANLARALSGTPSTTTTTTKTA
jgi:enamine deaminase RidA (YjgF/YER057c/UK114 family)